MRFGEWFKKWIKAFYKLLTFDQTKPKSDLQRRRERERRLKAKHAGIVLYQPKRKQTRRRRGSSVQNEKLLNALLGWIGATLGILLLPFGLLDWAQKDAKARRKAKSQGVAGKRATKPKPKATAPQPKKPSAPTVQRKPEARPSHTGKEAPRAFSTARPTERTSVPSSRLWESPEPKTSAPVVEPQTVIEADESKPKSTPKHEKDQYIRKRMMIAGSHDCDRAVLDTLTVGSYIDLEAEPTNPYDKDAVKLLYHGQKIGYIGKKDHMAFVTCLKLNRKIYGVITEIMEKDDQTKYEFEAWFDSEG